MSRVHARRVASRTAGKYGERRCGIRGARGGEEEKRGGEGAKIDVPSHAESDSSPLYVLGVFPFRSPPFLSPVCSTPPLSSLVDDTRIYRLRFYQLGQYCALAHSLSLFRDDTRDRGYAMIGSVRGTLKVAESTKPIFRFGLVVRSI